MRTLVSWLVFLVVFAICVLPFVLYQNAVRRGDIIHLLTPTGVGIFAAVTGFVGMALAAWAAQAVRQANLPAIGRFRFPRVAASRTGAIQILFAGITIAFVSFALQHYPIYHGILDSSLDLQYFLEAGWLIYVGGLMALYGGYRLAIGSKDGDGTDSHHG